MKMKKKQIHTWSDNQGFMGIIVNRVFPSMHVGLLNITRTVP